MLVKALWVRVLLRAWFLLGALLYLVLHSMGYSRGEEQHAVLWLFLLPMGVLLLSEPGVTLRWLKNTPLLFR